MNDRLNANEALKPGEERISANERARLIFQSDGNLVLYVARPTGWVPRWGSHTEGQPASTCVMQADGNLVIYDGAWGPLWATETQSHAGASLIVQGDENVVIYDAGGNSLWSTETWVGNWAGAPTGFSIGNSGLRFPNEFADANIAKIKLQGMCGGWCSTVLDYHFAGRPAPKLNHLPSTESNPLGAYIKARHIQSLAHQDAGIAAIVLGFLGVPIDLLGGATAGALPTYNMRKFIAMDGASDTTLRNDSFGEEFQKLRDELDAGRPVMVGLSSRGGLFKGHQVIAVDYRDGMADRWIRVLDPNHPGAFQGPQGPWVGAFKELWVSRDNDIVETSGEVWRGLFVDDYEPEDPPNLRIDEDLATHPYVFDANLYLRLHDLAAALGDDTDAARLHWLTFGTRELRRANTIFDPAFYLSHHPDLTKAFGADNGGSAIEHWMTGGIGEGRRSSAEFDVGWYLTNHQDLAAAFGAGNFAAALQHWLDYGLSEGRRSSADFNVGFYLASNPDLQAAFGPANYAAAFEHWLKTGKKEGRKPVP